MPQAWHLLSYSTGRLQSVFGKASEAEEAALMNMIDLEMGATPEDEIGMLAKKIAKEGIHYEALQPRQAEVVDQILGISFSQEGLWNELELEEEMPEGVDLKHITELLRLAGSQPFEVLPVLKAGRRYKCPVGPQCHYFILDRMEVPKLAQEARSLVTKTDLKWSSKEVPERLMDGLVMVCDFVVKKQKPLAGVLSQ